MQRTFHMVKSFYFFIMIIASNAFAQDAVLDLWNGNTPNLQSGAENVEEVVIDDPTWGMIVKKVSKPIVEVYLPPEDIATGTAVVICPGGGYVQLAWTLEGREVAAWLNSIGVAGIVLKYRLPDPAIEPVQHIAPIQDAQRAIRLVRSHSVEWNLDPGKSGIMGFSAGGHLAGSAAVHAESSFASVDAVDTLSPAPDFLILGYPVVTMGPGTHSGSKKMLLGDSPDPALVDYFSVEKQVDQNTPPTFIVVARNDDTVPYEPNSLALFNALQKVNVPSEMWVYQESIPPYHGFGLGLKSKESIEWPWRLAQWMKANGWSQIVPAKPKYTFLRILPKAFTLRSEATEKTVHIGCDTTWSILQKEGDCFSVDKQNGDKADSLRITISANESGDPRQGRMIIGNSARGDTLKIIQAVPGRYGLILTGGASPNGSEQEILSTAFTAGIVLISKDDDSIASVGPESENVDLILLSDTVSKTKVGDAYREVAVPVLVLETGLFEGMGMTAVRAYGQERNTERLDIVDSGHALAGGLAAGPRAVFSRPAWMNWGKPGGQAVIIAAIEGDPEKASIFAYETGATMADGFIAPQKRIGFFTTSSLTPLLTADGRQLLAAALTWLLNGETKVASNHPPNHPQQFVLRPNYPNPFNPSTTISYSLPQSGTAQLSIFNQQGRLVRKLVDRQLGAGPHNAEWDATDNAGVRVASGVYICKFMAGQFSAQNRMLLLR